MSENLSLENIISRIESFTKDRDWNKFHTVKNLVASISIESAELCETIQWTDPSVEEILRSSDLLNNISQELADVMIYCIRLCSVLDLDLLSIINNKINLNSQKYPVNRSKGVSTKYSNL